MCSITNALLLTRSVLSKDALAELGAGTLTTTASLGGQRCDLLGPTNPRYGNQPSTD